MSAHNIPLSDLERDGLIAHGLGRDIGKPSQAADIFRQGVNWALSSPEFRAKALQGRKELDEILCKKPDLDAAPSQPEATDAELITKAKLLASLRPAPPGSAQGTSG